MSDAASLKALLEHDRRPGDLVFGVFFVVFSLVLLSQLGSETQWVKGAKLFAQPGFWPAIGLTGMSLFAMGHLLSSVRALRPGSAGVSSTGASSIESTTREIWFWSRSLEYAVWFMVYVWIVPLIGYLPASLIFATALTLRVGYHDKSMLLKAAGMSVAIVVIFKSLLSVKIPGGQLYEQLPDGIRNFMLLYL